MRNARHVGCSLLAFSDVKSSIFPLKIAHIRKTLFSRQLQRLSTSPSSSCTQEPCDTLKIDFKYGLPVIDVPLPSRNEPCQFTLRPLSDTVGTLMNFLQQEDRGIDYVALYGKNGVKLATCTSIEHLLQFGSFRLRINDKFYVVSIPESPKIEFGSDKLRQLDDLKVTVASLHAALCVDEFKLARERKLLEDLETAETLLKPLHEEKIRLEKECEAHTERVMWAGFAAMGVQTGLFARLTWWEYSWDIMEPVTYFATYSTVIATFGYYLYTKENFDYPIARERVYTKQFYRRAQKSGFDIEKYNRLVGEVDELRMQLKRLRDPLFQHLPVSYLSRFDTK